MSERLFVYGSLLPGAAHAQLLAALPGEWRPARLRGRMDPLGWGLTGGYPALLPDPEGPWVCGQVLQSPALSSMWPVLDDFEGEAYRRVRLPVLEGLGDWQEAWVYTLHPALRGS